MKQPQQIVIDQLKRYGSISNVKAITGYYGVPILRLSSTIQRLREAGWDIGTDYEDKGRKKCIYRLKKLPKTLKNKA